MTDKQKTAYEWAKSHPDYRSVAAGHARELAGLVDELMTQDTAWISVKDRLPENEKDVLIAYTRKGLRGDVYSCVGMAFHTDGKTNTDDSVYSWQTEYIDMDYDEESDAYIIPEGW